MTIIVNILSHFIHMLMEVLPFFFLGIAFAALLESHLKLEFIFKYLRKGVSSIVAAVGIGAFLPGCACATIPMADALKEKGASLSTITAFLMVSPLIGPHTLILTYGMLGAKFAIGRLIIAIGGAIAIGLFVYWLEQRSILTLPVSELRTSSCCAQRTPSFTKRFIAMTQQLGGYFLIGIAIASVLSVLLPPSFFASTLAKLGIFSYVLAALVGIPIYVCEGEEIPITLALLGLGLPAGPAFAFMMGAVGTCIPTFLMARQIIGKKAAWIYIGLWLIFSPISGILFNTTLAFR